MEKTFKVAIIGLDTSHAVAFPELMQDPKTPGSLRIAGLRAVSCLRFETPFQNKDGLDKRQKYLEDIGVPVTENFEEATAAQRSATFLFQATQLIQWSIKSERFSLQAMH